MGNFDGLNKINDKTAGVKYNKNEIFDAMKQQNAAYSTTENEKGIFIEIHNIETNTKYLLIDKDKDGNIDSYRKSEYNIRSTSASTEISETSYDDLNFDGTFDRVVQKTSNNMQDFDSIELENE